MVELDEVVLDDMVLDVTVLDDVVLDDELELELGQARGKVGQIPTWLQD
jgi:hypothetical protein